jgi:hypothetical protein
MFSLKKYIQILVSASLILWNTGCSNDDGGVHEHAEARGLVLKMGLSTVVSVDSTIVTGQLTFPADNQFSDHIEVWFISDDEHRDEFRPDDLDERLNISVTDTNIATVLFHPDATDQDERWEFHVKGKTAGSTTLKVQIYHIDHPDYTSPLIPLFIE